jgi:TonB family protein
MKSTLTAILTLLSGSVFAQQVKYLNEHFTQINFKEKAVYYTETTKTGPASGIVKTFYMNGQLLSEENFSNLRYLKREGLTRNYYNNGNLKTEISYKEGVFNGPLKTYYPNQRLKRAELYENGQFVAGKCLTAAGYDTAHFAYQLDPQFPGGEGAMQEYLIQNTRIPITPIDYMLIKRGFKNFVIVKFVVTAEGDITDAVISRSLSTYHDRETMRLVEKMPKWNPGLQDGERTAIEYTLPIGFKM